MITLDLQRLCTIKGIKSPHAFLTANGFSHRTAHTLANGVGKSVRLAHLEKLCRIFNSLPHDLFNYKPVGRGINPSNDVLLPLRKKPLKTTDLNSLIASLPPDDIINLTTELQARYALAPRTEEPSTGHQQPTPRDTGLTT